MTRVLLLVCLFLLISIEGWGQCTNPPTVTLNGTGRNICGTNMVTVSGNTFGGSATSVTIRDDGSGNVTPISATSSPFTFSYFPKSKDIGQTVIITVTTNDPSGPCTPATATYTLRVNDYPSPPHAGTITMPTCSVATGSVAFSGLPSSGTWTITRAPGGVSTTGTGTTATISGIPPGTYTFTVTNSGGCTSSSTGVVINTQPVSPASSTQTVDCTLGFGKASVNVTSPTGTGLQYRLDAGAFQSGISFANVINGLHSVTVRNSSGCTTTGANFEVSCACVNQPAVTLSNSSGSTCVYTPYTVSGNSFGGSATSVTITENGAGTVSPVSAGTSPFAFTYTPAAGDAGNTVIITVTTNNPLGIPCAGATATCALTVNASPSAPVVGTITQPTCTVGTGNVILSGLPGTGSWRLTRTPGGAITTGTGTSITISALPSGTFTFTVTNANNCISASSANIIVNTQPSSPAAPVIGTITQPTCTVPTGSLVLSGLPSTGTWTLTRTPGGVTTAGTGTSYTISGLPVGTYSFTVTNAAGCKSASSAGVIISPQSSAPYAPVVGIITQPTCTKSTGSVLLSGLPSTGSWTLICTPGGITTTGSGTTATISFLNQGSYTFTVTNSTGCISQPSGNVLILAQPVIPSAPVAGVITPPTCSVLTGSVTLNGLPSAGTWILTCYPGAVTSTGTGTSSTITGLSAGIYNYMVTNAGGCSSVMSANVIIPELPVTPSAPLVGTVTQPGYEVTAGSVMLSGLPSAGIWIITLIPGNITTSGTGTSKTISDLGAGTYYFTVTNSAGCTSGASASVVINAPSGAPVVIITNPAPVCSPSTVDLTAPEITAGSTSNLTFSYWVDMEATIRYATPFAATAGIYYIKGINATGLFTVKPVTVAVYLKPVANAGPDQDLEYLFETSMAAILDNSFEKGFWSVIKGSGVFLDTSYPWTSVNNLSMGENKFLWTVTNGVCPVSKDSVRIQVNDYTIPSLITPNMDGRNDYFILRGLKALGKTALLIFNRSGVQVSKIENYDNSWYGIDYNGDPLPEGTYFYVLSSQNGKSLSGYIVIRR